MSACTCSSDECYWYPSADCPVPEHAERARARRAAKCVGNCEAVTAAMIKIDARCVRLRQALEALAGDLLVAQDVEAGQLRALLQGLSDRAWRIAKEPWT